MAPVLGRASSRCLARSSDRRTSGAAAAALCRLLRLRLRRLQVALWANVFFRTVQGFPSIGSPPVGSGRSVASGTASTWSAASAGRATSPPSLAPRRRRRPPRRRPPWRRPPRRRRRRPRGPRRRRHRRRPRPRRRARPRPRQRPRRRRRRRRRQCRRTPAAGGSSRALVRAAAWVVPAKEWSASRRPCTGIMSRSIASRRCVLWSRTWAQSARATTTASAPTETCPWS
mmetsp:Transcript_105389/g.302990  ORF Transcript_105389/g.302990 Transcript_105389/m.302990 type:complete len:229 (-) Transcript_105389:1627-2313(-)